MSAPNSHNIPIRPAPAQFLEWSAAGGHGLVPLWCEIQSDLFTPVMTYQTFRGDSLFSFILESVRQSEEMGRYSLVGFDPLYRFEIRRRRVNLYRDSRLISSEECPQPLKKIVAFMKETRPRPDPELDGFEGSLVGYLGYHTVCYFEKLADENPDDQNIADAHLILPRIRLVFDHLKQTVKIVCLCESGSEEAYRAGVETIGSILERLGRQSSPPGVAAHRGESNDAPEFESNMSKEEFLEKVKRAKRYIEEGDVFQVVLSQRFKMEYGGDPFQVYRALRSGNPSPYHYHLNFGDYALCGSSPEALVKKSGSELTLRPIAGTRQRGADAEEDARLREEMLNDPKEVAEHVMLVDLVRNDLGRVCEYGTVEVDEYLTVENYSHVMHIVSNVRGKAVNDLDFHELMRAVFPAGTLSGAPKVRAMEIIEELETVRRNTYSGGVAILDFLGNVNCCITIRSALFKNGFAFIQAGAGIVADSVPESEYEETFKKAKTVMNAVQLCKPDPEEK